VQVSTNGWTLGYMAALPCVRFNCKWLRQTVVSATNCCTKVDFQDNFSISYRFSMVQSKSQFRPRTHTRPSSISWSSLELRLRWSNLVRGPKNTHRTRKWAAQMLPIAFLILVVGRRPYFDVAHCCQECGGRRISTEMKISAVDMTLFT